VLVYVMFNECVGAIGEGARGWFDNIAWWWCVYKVGVCVFVCV